MKRREKESTNYNLNLDQQMVSDKNKVVQNYILLKLEQRYLDQSEIWTAQHKILKRNFTLRKIPYKSPSPSHKTSQASEQEPSTDNYEKTLKVTNLLKRLNLPVAPKCHKVIKTSNHLYVVYDQFPSCSLKQYLLVPHITVQQKFALMNRLVAMLQEVHKRHVAILNLSVNNVRIKEEGQIFVGNWDYATIINNSEEVSGHCIKEDVSFVADEVKKSGICGFSSDVFSLGKLFRQITNAGQLQQSMPSSQKLESLILKMTDKILVKRPSLLEIMKTIEETTGTKSNVQLKKYGFLEQQSGIHQSSQFDLKVKKTQSGDTLAQLSQEQFSDLSKTKDNTLRKTQKYIGSYQSTKFLRLNTVDTPTSMPSQFNLKVPITDEIKTPLRKNNTKITDYFADQSIKSLRLSKKSNVSVTSEHDKLARNITNKRNLAFLLLDLSQFVVRMDIAPELALLLLKKGLHLLKIAVDQWIKKSCDSRQDITFENILKSECLKIMEVYNLMKKNMTCFHDEHLRKELIDDKINQTYFKELILEFGKSMVIYCQTSMNKEHYNTKLVQTLFKTYLILKAIQEGSYQSFWNKISRPQNAYLSNQRYLRDQKSLGYRYLKCKIAEIISKQ